MSRGGRKEEIELTKKQELELENYVLRQELEIYKTFANSVYRWVKEKDYLNVLTNKNKIEWWHLNFVSNLVHKARENESLEDST